MKPALLRRKLLATFRGFATLVLIILVPFLLGERLLWKQQLSWNSGHSAESAARIDIDADRFQYLRLNSDSKHHFTGELKDGIEIWNYGYAKSFPFTTVFRLGTESYVSSYNAQMEWYVGRLDEPPSAVKTRSGELRHEDHKRRERAAAYLGMMGAQAEEAVPHLIEATSDEIVEVRAQAAWALGKIGPGDYLEEVISALELVREIPNSKMKAIASRALEEVIARNARLRSEAPK